MIVFFFFTFLGKIFESFQVIQVDLYLKDKEPTLYKIVLKRLKFFSLSSLIEIEIIF